MASAKNTPALRKRQQIENASKNMFLWVAGAAAIVGVAAVLSVSLFERISFKQEIIDAKNVTVSRLKKNNTVAGELKQKVRVLNTNQELLNTPRLENSQPLSVILDALPSSANSSALGASLQQKLLNESGITIEALTVEPVFGVEDTSENNRSSRDSGDNEIIFEFAISTAVGQESRLKAVLQRLERSIRTIDITTVTIEQQGSKLTMSAEGRAFYLPAASVELKEESKKP